MHMINHILMRWTNPFSILVSANITFFTGRCLGIVEGSTHTSGMGGEGGVVVVLLLLLLLLLVVVVVCVGEHDRDIAPSQGSAIVLCCGLLAFAVEAGTF